MGYIYVVRHGQADSLGKNYDQLTELGHEQARLLGEYFLQFRIEFDFIASGTLNRQIQTLKGAIDPSVNKGHCMAKPETFSDLNEFDPQLWIHIANEIRKEDPEFAKQLERYKVLQSAGRESSREIFMKLIQRILGEWVEGIHTEPYSFEDYHDKVLNILNHIPKDASSVLLVTSSTPVAVIAGHSIGLAKRDYLPLMRWISNTSLSVYQWEGGKISPITINSFPHIENPDQMSLL
ncbi:histidine phosphatase family protein [Leptospira sp. GIMC2001]|uniref:histidine phosphatase family protein n=1 Tax=Leptospira sp. GIMC2001 TaxID=1513297 RepID=UPI00234B81EE|nr:histidine phosphatase family protein [Leptospira sp. GIMC2001]WCL49736.1 phosphoglycerate mutase family protein [Leptospira sp. GIMC2001]